MNVTHQNLFAKVSIEAAKLHVCHNHPKKLTSKKIDELGGLESAIESVERCIKSLTQSYNVYSGYGKPERILGRLYRQIQKDQKILDKLRKKSSSLQSPVVK